MTRESVNLDLYERTAAENDGPKPDKQAHTATSSREAQRFI
jgi:hypothetical protein